MILDLGPKPTNGAYSGGLLDPALLKKLERLSLASRRPFVGQMKGEKRSLRRGTSIEFADYREYLPGDDLRYVDWNTAARLEKMFLKLFVEEEDLNLALLLDTSKSMDFGEPKKLRCAARIAAALGYIGLTNYDRIAVQPIAEASVRPLPVQRGRSGILPLFRYLESLTAEGKTSFATSVRRFASSSRRRGLAIVLSDFFDPNREEGLKALLAAGFQVTVLHVLAEEEIHPMLRGDLRALDSETGDAVEMSVSPQLLGRYQEAFALFCSEMEGFCRRYGVDYLRLSSAQPLEGTLLHHLRRGGMVK